MTTEFRVLGPLEVVRDGSPADLGGPQQRAVLALLLLRANSVVARERLIDELWPGDPPASAVNVLQTYVSHLRKALPEERLLTRPPGYLLRVEPGELDLARFEELHEAGRRSLAEGDAQAAARTLRDALALWRGPPLGDVARAGFAGVEAGRLEELRLAALEDRIAADLELERHAELVGELEALVAEQPLREHPRALLMRALYRAGRQPEALAVYRSFRTTLADELGIEPGATLRELEGAILRQDPSLDGSGHGLQAAPARRRTVLVACVDEESLDTLVTIAAPLVRQREDELVLIRLVDDAGSLESATRVALERRSELTESGVEARAAAFTSSETAADVIRLAGESDVALLLVDAMGRLDDAGRFDQTLADVVSSAPCDVAVLVGGGAAGSSSAVLVPFGGSEHEWAAAEIGAWIAKVHGLPLRLAGTAADEESGRRDASRLLASVALLVQRVAGVDAEPALGPPGADSLVALAREASVVLLGLPDGWEDRGVGATRAELARRAERPTLLIRGGLRPGGLAPVDGLTRFTWTLSTGAPDPRRTVR